MKRAIVIVLDSVGMGELPDASKYGDEGSNTLGNIAAKIHGFELLHMQRIGLGNIDQIKGFEKCPHPQGSFGRMKEQSPGKDTTTGHWEMAGVVLGKAFPTFPNGFPKELLDAFEESIGTKTLGNIAASGTEIIKMLGDEHAKTGYPIIYTSADSVFQIAVHEQVVPIEKLYGMCQTARNLLKGDYAVGRVIARPFTGTSGNYRRTDQRRDFSLKPIGKTILDYAVEHGLAVKAVGKIEDIFSGQGITEAVHTHGNMDGVDQTLRYMKEEFEGILFTNLVDFDMLYGHRNDIEGYAKALTEFDQRLPEIMEALKEDDLLVITADHGCDPTTASTDHSREYVPLLVYGHKIKKNVNLGTRNTFADIAASLADFFGMAANVQGESFYGMIKGMGA